MKNVIYKISNVINGKFYVGSTVDSRKRFWAHRKALRTGNHDCIHLQRAWNKYGEDCFKFEIIQQLDNREELYPAEQKLLDEHFGQAYCYNVAAHADSPMRDASPEMRALLAERTKAWLEREGHPRLGKKNTPETLAKIAANRVPPKGESHYRFGKTLDEATRKKIGDAQRGVAKAPRVYTEEGRARAQENMRRNAREQKPMDFSVVLAKFPDEVKSKYDFSQAVYTSALVRIEKCICPIHGEFSQYAAQFRKGRGCPSCGQDQRSATRSAQMKQSWANPEEREKMMQARQNKLDIP